MIRQSSAFAELRRMSRSSLGSQPLTPRLDMPSLLSLYEAHMQALPAKRWSFDVPLATLQAARISDVERTYDRFVRQILAYWTLHVSQSDPAWTAVTGYYTAFFGAQTLLSLVGMSGRGIMNMLVIPQGLYHFQESQSQFQDHTLVTLIPHGKGGSHGFLWKQVTRVLDRVSQVPGNDPTTAAILASLRQTIAGPPGLSQSRNLINYSVDLRPGEVRPWASELTICDTEADLESRILVTSPVHDGQRFELVALACGALSRALYEDYLARGVRVDRRPSASRMRSVAHASENHPALAWV